MDSAELSFFDESLLPEDGRLSRVTSECFLGSPTMAPQVISPFRGLPELGNVD